MPKKQPEQLYLDGTEPPPDPDRIPAVDERLNAWLESKDEKRRTADKHKDNEHLLMHEVVARGLERYPYVDSLTGKKRYFVADKTPKPKTIAAISADKKPKKKRDVEEIEKREENEANRVESRRVSRASVAAEIGEVDGFANVRELMNKTEH